MFKSLRIRNYRIFKDLQVDGLHRINLIGGRNNAGKTSFLEAIFLLAVSGNPRSTMDAEIFRTPEQSVMFRPMRRDRERNIETFWRQIFYAADISQTIMLEGTTEVKSQATSSGQLALDISVFQPETIEVVFEPDDENIGRRAFGGSSLVLTPKYGGKAGRDSRIDLTDSGMRIGSRPNDQVSLKARMLLSGSGDTREDAVELAELKTKRQDDLVYKALRIIEPRLQSILDNSASGEPMIWADIDGLPELVPLPVMGDGMTRLARMLLAIVNAPNGVVLLDEIENGLHYSVQSEVWKTIAAASEQFDTQIFATTHSFEFLRAAYKGLGSKGFRYFRLGKTRGGESEAVMYRPEMIQTAICRDMEVR